MKLLIDSHVLLWLLFEPERLKADAINTLEAAESVSVSVASLWELTLKYSKGKLKYPPAILYKGLAAANVEILPVKPPHLLVFPNITLPHGDPFDQLLIAQNEAEGCMFLTADKQLLGSKYRAVQA